MNLFKALSYKEWIKTRKFVFVALVLSVVIIAYSYIDITYAIRIDGAVNVWYDCIFQGSSVSGIMMYFMPLSGIAMALVQFVPEMTNKRFKLTLHLPVGETNLVSCMLLYGYGVLSAIYVACMIFLSLVFTPILPVEVLCMMDMQLLPWALAGLAGYGFVVTVCVEPVWKQRICDALISLGLLSIFFISFYPGAYAEFGLEMFLIVASSFVFPFYSCMRFKQGVQ